MHRIRISIISNSASALYRSVRTFWSSIITVGVLESWSSDFPVFRFSSSIQRCDGPHMSTRNVLPCFHMSATFMRACAAAVLHGINTILLASGRAMGDLQSMASSWSFESSSSSESWLPQFCDRATMCHAGERMRAEFARRTSQALDYRRGLAGKCVAWDGRQCSRRI